MELYTHLQNYLILCLYFELRLNSAKTLCIIRPSGLDVTTKGYETKHFTIAEVKTQNAFYQLFVPRKRGVHYMQPTI